MLLSWLVLECSQSWLTSKHPSSIWPSLHKKFQLIENMKIILKIIQMNVIQFCLIQTAKKDFFATVLLQKHTHTSDLVSAVAFAFSSIITVMLHYIHLLTFINPCVENLPHIHPFAAGAAAALFHRSGSKIIGASRVDCFAQGYCDSDCWGEGGLAYYLSSYSQDKQKIKRA